MDRRGMTGASGDQRDTPDPAQGGGRAKNPVGEGSVPSRRGEGEGERREAEKKLLQLRPKPSPDIDRAAARFPLTDLGNAERFVLRYGDNFRFCPELGWFRWDGRRWELLSEEKDRLPAPVMQAVFATVRAIKNEAALVRDSGVRNTDGSDPEGFAMDIMIDAKKGILYSDKIAEWARTSESSAKLNCIASLAKSFTSIVVTVGDFDADRMAVNCLNGTLRIEQVRRKRPAEDIAAGKSEWHTVWDIVRHPHRREDLITKITRVSEAMFDKLAVLAIARDGEVLIRKVEGRGPHGCQLQLAGSELCTRWRWSNRQADPRYDIRSAR